MALRIARSEDSEDQEDVTAEYVAAKEAADQANKRLKEAQQRLMDQMQQRQQKSETFSYGGNLHTVTYVQSQRVKVDEKGLRKALSAKVYDKYTKKTLDRGALETAMGEGTIDPMVVQQYVSTEQTTPFVRHTFTKEVE